MKTMLRQVCVFLIGLMMLFSASTLAFAQSPTSTSTEPTPSPLVPAQAATTGIDLTVSPVFINLLTDPGKPVKTEVKIKNNNNQTEYLEIRYATFEATSDGARPKLIDADPGDEMFHWISVSSPQFTLAPLETKTIGVTITPAKTAGLGYYYGIIFQRIAEQEATGKQAIVAGAPAVSILLEVKSPNAKRELQLVDFTTDNLFYEYLPTTFRATIKNTGNIHLMPAGDIFIDSLTTKEVAILPFNEARGNILPQSTRTFEVTWDDAMIVRTSEDEEGHALVDKEGNLKPRTSWDFAKADKFRIGKYTANILMVYDNGERDVPLEATVSFWVIPWKILAIAAVIATFFIVGLRSTIMSWIRKMRSASSAKK